MDARAGPYLFAGSPEGVDRSPQQLPSISQGYLGAPLPRPSRRKPRPRVPDDRRKRAARACNECRRKKEKCDGKPPCSRCCRYHIECRYAAVSATVSAAMSTGTSDVTAGQAAPPIRTTPAPSAHRTSFSLSTDGPLTADERLRCMEKIFAYCLVGRSLGDDELRSLAQALPGDGSEALASTGITVAATAAAQATQAPSPTPPPGFRHTTGHGTGHTPGHASISASTGRLAAEPCEDLLLTTFTHRLASAIEKEKHDSDDDDGEDDGGSDAMDEEDEDNADTAEPPSHVYNNPYGDADGPDGPDDAPSPSDTARLAAITAALNAFPPQEIASFLLDVFFRYTQTSIYYVEESWVYQFVEACYATSSPSSPGGSHAVDDIASVCTVLLVMTCGTQFAHLESFRRNEQMAAARRADPTAPPPHFSEDDIGRQFYRVALPLMPYVLAGGQAPCVPASSAPTFRSVQACLMMATYHFSLDSAGASYTYLSLALSLAVQLGMHQDQGPAYDRLDAVAAEARRRVWWTVYILHVQLSIKYGRPGFLVPPPSILSLSSSSSISPASLSAITVRKPADLPALRPSREPPSFANQAGLIELTLATQAIAHEIDLLRRTNRAVHFVNLLSIRQKLVRWWDAFQDSNGGRERDTEKNDDGTSWSTDAADTRRLRNDIHLRLYYWNTRLSLGRPFLLLEGASGASPAASPAAATDSAAPAENNRFLLGKAALIQDSLSGALETIRLCQLLRERVGVARASYATEFTCCRTAMLVLLAQGLTHLATPAPTVRDALARGLAIIKIMAVGSSALARSEARVIEALERAVDRLDALQRRRRRNGRASGGGGASAANTTRRAKKKTNYDAFCTWTRLWQTSSSSSGFMRSTEDSTSPASVSVSPPSTAARTAQVPPPGSHAASHGRHASQQAHPSIDYPAHAAHAAHSAAHLDPMNNQGPFPLDLRPAELPLLAAHPAYASSMETPDFASTHHEFMDAPYGDPHLSGSLPLELSQFDIITGFDPAAFDHHAGGGGYGEDGGGGMDAGKGSLFGVDGFGPYRA